MPESWGDTPTLAARIQAIRLDLFGAQGGSMLARLLCVPHRRLARMEAGDPIPGHLILRFIEVTKASPHWLLTGQGDRYRHRPVNDPRGGHWGRMPRV